jgi:hypothetical protein
MCRFNNLAAFTDGFSPSDLKSPGSNLILTKLLMLPRYRLASPFDRASCRSSLSPLRLTRNHDNLLENFQEQITTTHRIEKLLPSITAAGNEVPVTRTVKAPQTFGHGGSL